MSLPRFFVDTAEENLECGSQVDLSPEDSHHAQRVLRLREKDEIIIVVSSFNRQFRAIVSHSDSVVRAELLSELPAVSSGIAVSTLLVPLLKGSRTEDVADWATELGVERIICWHAQRSVSRIKESDRSRKAQRLIKIVEQAAKQSQGAEIPDISIAGPLEEAIGQLRPDEHLVCLSLTPGARSLGDFVRDVLPVSKKFAVLIGPEGDLTSAEEELAGRHKATFLYLGPRILRSELAAITGIILMNGLSSTLK